MRWSKITAMLHLDGQIDQRMDNFVKHSTVVTYFGEKKCLNNYITIIFSGPTQYFMTKAFLKQKTRHKEEHF